MYYCRACKNEMTPFFSLGKIPLVNSFLKKGQLKKERKFDLTVAFCPNCYLTQLTKTINPKELFTDYIYFSGTSKLFLKHCEQLSKYLTKRLKLNSKSLVLEIASNDGSFLQYFKKLGIKVLGIDPAKNIAAAANRRGVKTINEFFNLKTAKKLKKEKNVQADLIFGANVLAHVPNIVDFVKGVKVSLKPQGTAIFEFPYLRGLFENKFDIIYHEHVFYYSLIALQNLFKLADLEIYDVEITPMQGGSLLIYISHPNVFKISDKVKKLKNKELQEGFHKISTYKKMNKNVTKLKKDLITLLDNIKNKNKTIAAYSAPAKGIILLNYFGIDSKYVDFIVDKAKEKQNLYVPGVHLLVYPPEKIIKDMPDYTIILCWNIADEIIKQLSVYKKNKGKFIIPVPKIKIV